MGGCLTRRLGYGAAAAVPWPVPDFANVVLLMGFEGADGATTFTDESSFGRSASAGGNAQIDTAFSKFGSSSLLSDGSGDCVSLPYWTLDKDGAVAGIVAGQDVQMEAWIRFASGANLTNPHTLFSIYQSVSDERSFQFFFQNGTLGLTYYPAGTSPGTSAVSASWSPSTATWYHVAYSRVSAISRLFVDGVKLAESAANNFTSRNTGIPFRIGALSSGGVIASSFNGNMDEARCVVYESGAPAGKLYTADFTPPTAAFPRS